MRWTRALAACAALAALAATAVVSSCSKTSTQTSGSAGTSGTMVAAEDPVAHGRRLVWSSGCVDCHTPGSLYGTPDTTRMLSGSELGWKGPWGVSFPRNLTPDSATGIGTWTEDQIVTAFTTGHRPNGTPLLPPMPWPGFGAGFNQEEAHAIAKYLKTLPPIKHKAPDVIPPGQPFKGAALVFPPPSAWDAMNLPPPGAPAGGAPGGAPGAPAQPH